MLIVSYDISNTKLRTKFAKFLKQYGRRIQFSIFEVQNSERVLKNIILEINHKYEPLFTGADSVLIFHLGASSKIHRYGYAKNEESDLVFL